MATHPQPRKLIQGIRDLRTALFSNGSRSLIKLPTDVVQDVIVDPSGYLWFQVSTRLLDLDGMDKIFPAQLRFYDKNQPYFMEIDGTATVVPDKQPTPHPGKILIRYTIRHAERHRRRLLPRPSQKSSRRLLSELFPIAHWQPASIHGLQVS